VSIHTHTHTHTILLAKEKKTPPTSCFIRKSCYTEMQPNQGRGHIQE